MFYSGVHCIGNLFSAEYFIQSLGISYFTCIIVKRFQVLFFCLPKETLNILLQWIAQYPNTKSLASWTHWCLCSKKKKVEKKNSSLLAKKPCFDSLPSLLLKIYLRSINSKIFCLYPHKTSVPICLIPTTLRYTSWISQRETDESCNNYWCPDEYPAKTYHQPKVIQPIIRLSSNKAIQACFLDSEPRSTGSRATLQISTSYLCDISVNLSIRLSQLDFFFSDSLCS